ncbi:MAG: NAD(P)/FAD-dependent oxidoreductase [Deltaproteobacteria bacterium]|nr:NAD(P)/FAD-dependent oxidoreductase [Deltaproteobacteria bacterium]
MASRRYDAIVIGAGHNGLITAAYLAKAGKKVLVLERRSIVGGIAVTEEIFPGFKFSPIAHVANGFAGEVIADLDLRRHGLDILALDPLLLAPTVDGQPLVIPRNPSQATAQIARHSQSDAQKYSAFCALLKNLAGFLRTIYDLSWPDKTTADEKLNPFELIKAGLKFRGLGEKQMYEFLRILPMSSADLLNEWFESDLLKASLAASGMLGSFVGPRQQGSCFNLLQHQLGESNGALRTAGFVRGGIGNLTRAVTRAAQQAGAEIRTGSEVVRVTTKHGAATGVVLSNGDEIGAQTVISGVGVKRTFQKLVEPTYLDPHFLLAVKNIRARGTVAKINFALDALPKFKGSEPSQLAGVIHIGPTLDYLERAADDAKYGRFSKQPFLEITIPSLSDPSLAPAGKHVMSVWMQSAPYHLKDGNWAEQRNGLGDTVVGLIEQYASGFDETILHGQVLTPLDLEQTYGLDEGHPYHAELALDQLFFMRPVPGWSRYRTPIENLYLCGSGTHPGGLNGLSGKYAAREILKRHS